MVKQDTHLPVHVLQKTGQLNSYEVNYSMASTTAYNYTITLLRIQFHNSKNNDKSHCDVGAGGGPVLNTELTEPVWSVFGLVEMKFSLNAEITCRSQSTRAVFTLQLEMKSLKESSTPWRANLLLVTTPPTHFKAHGWDCKPLKPFSPKLKHLAASL